MTHITHKQLRLIAAGVAIAVLTLGLVVSKASASEVHCPRSAPKDECYIPGEYEREHEHDHDQPTTTTTAPTYHDEASIPTTKVIIDDTVIHTGPAGGDPGPSYHPAPAPSTTLPALPKEIHVNG